jgi:hypothetical protein
MVSLQDMELEYVHLDHLETLDIGKEVFDG